MTPLTSSTCRCTSLTFEEELAICACGSSAVAARAAAFAMNGRAPVGSRLAAGPSAYIIHVSRRAAAWRRARLPSARVWLNKRPAARGAPATACCPVAGRRGALLPTSLALSCPHYQPHPL